MTGIVPPMVTPLRQRDELDVEGLQRLIERILGGGVDGLFILGTTGEGPCLSYRLRRELIELTCRQVRGRIPVLVGITDAAFVESVSLARHAAKAGAEALVLAPPFYFAQSQREVQAYLSHLVAELPLPLFLYNTPTHTKVSYNLETLRHAMDLPQVIGLKDSSMDMSYFQEAAGLLRQRPDWSLLIGPEELLAEAIRAGGHGGVPGGANLFPELYVQLCAATRHGDVDRSRQLHEQVLLISDSLYRFGGAAAGVIKGVKCALACLGVCADTMAEPFVQLPAQAQLRVRENLAKLTEGVERLVSTDHPTNPACQLPAVAVQG